MRSIIYCLEMESGHEVNVVKAELLIFMKITRVFFMNDSASSLN